MKVAVQCESPLLQRSLEIFLGTHLSSLKQCDVVVRDKSVPDDSHPTLLVGTGSDADLIKPFSYSQLMLTLEQMLPRVAYMPKSSQLQKSPTKVSGETDGRFVILQKNIELITQEYQKKIMEVLQEYHGG